MNATLPHIAETAELLQAGRSYRVTVTVGGWIEIRTRPEHQMDPAAKLDFLRLVCEDEAGYWSLYHFSHNEVLKGTATFSHSLVSAMYATVTNFFDGL